MNLLVKKIAKGGVICFLSLLGLLPISYQATAQSAMADSLIAVLHQAKEDTNTVNALNKLGEEYRKTGMYDSALAKANQAFLLANRLPQGLGLSGAAMAYNNMAIVYTLQDDYSSGLKYFKKSLEIREKQGDKNGIAGSLINIAIVYRKEGDYLKSLDYNLKGLKIAEEINNLQWQANVLGNMGSIYSLLGDYSTALKSYNQSQKIAEKLGNKASLAAGLNNIGGVYFLMGQKLSYPSNALERSRMCQLALSYFQNGLQINKEIGNKNGIIKLLGNIGGVYLDLANNPRLSGEETKLLYAKASDHFLKAIQMSKEIGNKASTAINLGNLGTLYTETGRYAEAEKSLFEALDVLKGIKALESEKDIETSLTKLYEKTNKYLLAFKHYQRQMVLKDSIYSQENRKEMTRKEMTFQFEKKEAATKATQEKQALANLAEKKKQQVILYSVLAGLGVVLVFALIIFRSLRTTRMQKLTIEKQKHLVEEKQKEILDSIHYAKRIQNALLPPDKYIHKSVEQCFILFKPKDIVSGDFYYARAHKNPNHENELFFLATADCTGHGVPGAFMSMLGVSALNESIIEKNISSPKEILHDVRNSLIASLNPEGSEEESKDGMDCVLTVYDFENMKMHFTAANNPLWLVRGGELVEFKPDKVPVGKYGDVLKPFTEHTINLQKDDIVYTFTDGYADQFGGPKGKKFKYKQLQEKLLAFSSLPLEKQEASLRKVFDDWKGNMEQIDDVLLIAVKV